MAMMTIRSLCFLALLGIVTVLGQDDACLVIRPNGYKEQLQAAATNCTATEGQTTCAIDYADFPAAQNLEAGCTNISGTFQPKTYSLKCGSITFEAQNIPYCLTSSCNEEALKEYEKQVQDGINEVYKTLEIDCELSAAFSFAAAGVLMMNLTSIALIGIAAHFVY